MHGDQGALDVPSDVDRRFLDFLAEIAVRMVAEELFSMETADSPQPDPAARPEDEK